MGTERKFAADPDGVGAKIGRGHRFVLPDLDDAQRPRKAPWARCQRGPEKRKLPTNAPSNEMTDVNGSINRQTFQLWRRERSRFPLPVAARNSSAMIFRRRYLTRAPDQEHPRRPSEFPNEPDVYYPTASALQPGSSHRMKFQRRGAAAVSKTWRTKALTSLRRHPSRLRANGSGPCVNAQFGPQGKARHSCPFGGPMASNDKASAYRALKRKDFRQSWQPTIGVLRRQITQATAAICGSTWAGHPLQ